MTHEKKGKLERVSNFHSKGRFFGRTVVLTVILFVLLVVTVGCSKVSETSLSKALKKNDLATVEKIFSNIDSESLSKLVTKSSSPGGDFSYTLLGDESGLAITKYDGPGGLVIIPAEIEGYPVKDLEDDAFRGNYLITSVIIPSSVNWIGRNCFEECLNLTSVFIPSSVTLIGADAFRHCYDLSVVKIMPGGIETLGAGCFEECNALVSIELPEPLKEIYNVAFYKCKNLREVQLPDTVEEMKDGVFYKCEKLHTINIPKSIKVFGSQIFEGCSELYNLQIPDEMEKFIDSWDTHSNFKGCTKLPIETRKRLQELGYTGRWNTF